MKTYSIVGLLCVIVSFWSCSDDDEVEAKLLQPTFTITQSAENSALYSFENTTPNKDEFYCYWEFEVAGNKAADVSGAVEHEYNVDGDKLVTLTMVSSVDALQASETIFVTVPVDDVVVPTNAANLLANAYLLEGSGDDFTNWAKANGGDRMSATTDALIGTRAIYVNNGEAGNAWDAQLISDEIETVVGDEYTFSFWAKGDAVIRFSTQPSAQYGADYTLTSEWTQYSWTITANEPMTKIALDMGAAAGSFVIDVIEAVKGTEALPLPGDNGLILNSGFEEGDGDDFTNWGKYNGPDRIAEETTDVKSGSRAVYVNNEADGNAWDTQFVCDAVETEIGADYTVSFWAKGDACVVRFSTQPEAMYGPDYTITEDWTQFSWTFTANVAMTNIAFDMGTTAGSFVLDDVKMVKN